MRSVPIAHDNGVENDLFVQLKSLFASGGRRFVHMDDTLMLKNLKPSLAPEYIDACANAAPCRPTALWKYLPSEIDYCCPQNNLSDMQVFDLHLYLRKLLEDFAKPFFDGREPSVPACVRIHFKIIGELLDEGLHIM